MSWVEGADESQYSIHHLPFGVFSTRDDPTPRIGVRIADFVLDMRMSVASGTCPGCPTCAALSAPALNPFMSLGRAAWSQVRGQVQESLTNTEFQRSIAQLLVPVSQVRMHLPFVPGDFVDFLASGDHAANLGRIYRPEDVDPLPPAWRHLPPGHHGRAGSVVVSGTDIVRPAGQRRDARGDISFGPSAKLDIEAELGFVVGVPTNLGSPVGADSFADHVFGVVLVNDWSARDIGSFEYKPLGPLNGKSFATSVSGWVTPLEALAAARGAAPEQPATEGYLKESDRFGYDVAINVHWNGTEVSRPSTSGLYWTPAQLLAQLTSGGAALRTGDLFATGAVSGPRPSQAATFLELSHDGARPILLDDGSDRTYLQDGDTVTLTATAPGPRGTTVGLGEVTAMIRPAIG
ncbi:fumarylacetoacetate hydrolase family protein [Stackebrandtia soli]|uniref:fumarylacetoacetate hydrolase family protein n=1 Tax=Stackebrandtia soli TaxID=1892856 RepID=UPI0039E74924